jgi:hypothetical protein
MVIQVIYIYIYIVRSSLRSIVNTVAGHTIGIQLVGCSFGNCDTSDMYVYIYISTYLFISLFQSIVSMQVIHYKPATSLAIEPLGTVIPYKGYLVTWL